ncbi:hypothetical protein Q3G72_019588 [Acer saccharum]|nr:hypothetical protein Q3G72_019588 [Acer saccharum]
MIGWSKKFQDDYHSNNCNNHPGTSDMIGSLQGSGDRTCNLNRTNGWQPPDKDEYKTNCGAVVDNKSGRVGFRIIIRNSIGEVMACCSHSMEANLSNRTAKLMDIQRGIQFGLECGLTPSNIESDKATVVKWINTGLNRDSENGVNSNGFGLLD